MLPTDKPAMRDEKHDCDEWPGEPRHQSHRSWWSFAYIKFEAHVIGTVWPLYVDAEVPCARIGKFEQSRDEELVGRFLASGDSAQRVDRRPMLSFDTNVHIRRLPAVIGVLNEHGHIEWPHSRRCGRCEDRNAKVARANREPHRAAISVSRSG